MSEFMFGQYVVPIAASDYDMRFCLGQTLVVHSFACGLPVTRAPGDVLGGYKTLPDGTKCNFVWHDHQLRAATAAEIAEARLAVKKRKRAEYNMVRRVRARMKRKAAQTKAEA